MKNLVKFSFSLGLLLCLSLCMISSVFADTQRSREYTNSNGTGSRCSMITVATQYSNSTSLTSWSFDKSAALGYSFETNKPYKRSYATYDIYISNNKLKWMNGATSWSFQLNTTHSYKN